MIVCACVVKLSALAWGAVVAEPPEEFAAARAGQRDALLRTASALACTGAGSAALALGDSALLPTYAAVGGIVSAVCAVLAGAARAGVHHAVVRAIADGEDRVGVPEFDRVRRRLLDPAHRARLAGVFDHHRRARGAALEYAPVPRHSHAAVHALGELSEVLRAEPGPGPRAVAICTMLVMDGIASPLYGARGEGIAEELGRVRFHAAREAAGDAQPPS
jgi:hypothetical protein